MGFTRVHDYAASKVDWMGSGLPWEGTGRQTPRLGDVVDASAPTCSIDEAVGDVRSRIDGWPFALVVNESRVVLGLARSEALGMDAGRRVAAVMQEGPSTYRPDVPARELVERFVHHPRTQVVVTTLDGRLLGVASAAAIEKAANGQGR